MINPKYYPLRWGYEVTAERSVATVLIFWIFVLTVKWSNTDDHFVLGFMFRINHIEWAFIQTINLWNYMKRYYVNNNSEHRDRR